MKTKCILIPTDFTVSSLNLLKKVLSSNIRGEQFDIVLLHGIYLDYLSITDLMFFRKHEILKQLIKPEFSEALMILKNKYQSSIRTIREDIFTGLNQTAFNNFIKNSGIDEVFVHEDYNFIKQHKSSFNLIPYIKKSGLKINGVSNATPSKAPEVGQIAEILINPAPAR